MKIFILKLTLAAFISTMATIAIAQEEPKPAERPKPRTLFNNGPVKVSGFGAPILEWSEMNSKSVFSMGGAGAVLLNDFFIGGYGQGVTTTLTVTDNFGRTNYLSIGHGGLWFGYAFPASKLVHFHASIKTGWGGIASRYTRNWSGNDEYFVSSFFAFTPDVGLELNVADFMRLNANVGYRSISQSDEVLLTNSDLSSFTGNLTLKFGWFR